MSFELLAEEADKIDSGGLSGIKWSWLDRAAHLRRGVTQPGDLTARRSNFMIQHAMDLDGVDMRAALEDPKIARGSAKSLPCELRELELAELAAPKPDVALLPAGSAAVSLRFKLLSPLLTRDDDPFYLFDNPVRKDRSFRVPFLSAASIKGLAADAFQRGFPGTVPWVELGAKDQDRTIRYRRDQASARRLFGIASDEPDTFASEAGRVHFSPVWFSHVQFLVMNPTREDGSGIGTQPIQFEAIAPVDDKGRVLHAQVDFFYFNPAGTPESNLAYARTDLACLVGAMASWWPALGLGAKRLAGYGAIEPLSARCHANGYPDMPEAVELSGLESWMKLAERIAGKQR